MKSFKVTMNVAHIMNYGNAGGQSVSLSPTVHENHVSGTTGMVSLHLNEDTAKIADFKTGEYEVTFTEVG